MWDTIKQFLDDYAVAIGAIGGILFIISTVSNAFQFPAALPADHPHIAAVERALAALDAGGNGAGAED